MGKCGNVLEVDGEIYVKKSSLPKKIESIKGHGYPIGEQFYVQTATFYYVGTLIAVTETDFVLVDWAWIPEVGRFNEFFKGSKPKQLEPGGQEPIFISRGGYISATKTPAKLIVEVI